MKRTPRASSIALGSAVLMAVLMSVLFIASAAPAQEPQVTADVFEGVPERAEGGAEPGEPIELPVHTMSLLESDLRTIAQPSLSRIGSSTVSTTWQQVGPNPSLFGQPENVTDSPESGAIEAVAAHPSNADILWIGAVNGGIWRTDNATAASPNWTQQTDSMPSLSIGALEIDPTVVGSNTLVAGIGRTSSYAGLGGSQTGILRTTNGGTSWSNPGSVGLGGARISGVAPRGSTIVVAVEESDFGFLSTGIFRSADSGATFTQISGGSGTGLPIGRAWDLASDPGDDNRVYTIIRDTGTPGSSGIYRSNDAGATWTKISSATQDATLNAPSTDANLAVSSTSQRVFAAICTAGELASLDRSTTAATGTPTWASLDLPTTTEQGTQYGIHPGGQCAIHLSLVADPSNNDVVYIGGDRQPSNDENGSPVAQFPNSIGASTFGGRLFKVDASQAGGSQATPITNCMTALAGCGGSARTANDTAPHADSREMVFDANGDLIQVDDGGIYKHTSPSGTNGDWFSIIGDLGVFEQHDMTYDPVSNIFISGNQDNGTTAQPVTSSSVWNSIFGGDGGDVAIGVNDPVAGQSTRYVSAQRLLGASRLVYDSSNVLQSFAPLGLNPGIQDPIVPQFVTPIAINAVNPAAMLIGGFNSTYFSTDRGDNITELFIGGGLPPNAPGGRPIDYGTASDPNAFYFVNGDDVVCFTDATGGSAFLRDPDAGTDTTLAVRMDPSESETAVVIDSNQVFRTTNSGANWTDITGNLQALNPGTLRSVEFMTGTLLVGTDNGVFSTTGPAFTTWSVLGTGLPNAPVLSLDYNATDDVLSAGTMGRGTWRLASSTCPSVINLANQTISVPQTFTSLGTLTATNVTIAANVIFEAVGTVGLNNGFRVNKNVSFRAESNSGITCP